MSSSGEMTMLLLLWDNHIYIYDINHVWDNYKILTMYCMDDNHKK